MEMPQHNKPEIEFAILLPRLCGHGFPADFGWQPSAPQEEWWPTHEECGSSASVLAGSPFGPQIGASSKGLEKALGILGPGGLRYRVGMFISLAKPNKSVKPLACGSLGHSVLRTCSGMASPLLPKQALRTECRLPRRYV